MLKRNLLAVIAICGAWSFLDDLIHGVRRAASDESTANLGRCASRACSPSAHTFGLAASKPHTNGATRLIV